MSHLVWWILSLAVVGFGAYSWGFHNGSQAGFYHRRPERRTDSLTGLAVEPETKRAADAVSAKVPA